MRARIKRSGRAMAAVVALCGLLLPAARAAADDGLPAPAAFQTAALTDGDMGRQSAELPRVLSRTDVRRYRKIFAVQEDGDWKAADRLIDALEDRVLMGHVLAQRYLHPTDYRTPYRELKAWLAEYHDHPQAKRLYKLALKRRPKNWRYPHRPSTRLLSGNGHLAERRGDLPAEPRKRLSRAQRQEAREIKRRIRRYARNGWTLAVKRVLREDRTKKLLSTVEYDRARAKLAAGYFADGRDEWAVQWGAPAGKRSGTWVPQANWTAGLASWRLGRYDAAGTFFEKAAEAPGQSAWMASASAFWAARTHLVNEHPEKVNRWLHRAADHAHTFYGLIARRMLGLGLPFRWQKPPLDATAVERLKEIPAARRAVALLQVGEPHLAERDLRTVAAKLDREQQLAVLGLAVHGGLPSLSMRLDGLLFPDGDGYDAAAYPVPDWQPPQGFRVDRALILALIRQESGFNPKAKSYAGARGLMQLMPRTASFVAGDRRLRYGKRKRLFDPEFNLSLGQKFVEILLDDRSTGGDLFRLAAAWNGGPGNVNKWRRKSKHMDDPLLFIECIPLHETRKFVERVLTNLWIYRSRLGQPTPSLDAIAAGELPHYAALDRSTVLLAESHGED